MNVLIATSGVLAPGPAADLVQRLTRDGDKVHVVTVMEVPRSFLDDVRSDEWHPDQNHGSIETYVEERGRRITAPMMEALAERGVDAHPNYLEGDDPAAAIITTAAELGVDLLVMGATKMIFQGWESVSTRVMNEAEIPVLVVPAPKLEPEDDEA